MAHMEKNYSDNIIINLYGSLQRMHPHPSFCANTRTRTFKKKYIQKKFFSLEF